METRLVLQGDIANIEICDDILRDLSAVIDAGVEKTGS